MAQSTFKSAALSASVLVCLLMLVSCGNNYEEISHRYHAEKLLYEANRDFQTMTVNGKIKDAQSRRKLLDKFEEALHYCGESIRSIKDTAGHPAYRELGTVAFGAANRIAQLYFADGYYDKGAQVLDTLLASFPLSNSERINSTLNLGQALHTGGRIDSALAVYHRLISDSLLPVSDRGTLIYPLFNLPLHVYKIDKAAKKASLDQDFALAENYYTQLMARPNFTQFRDACNTNLAMLYIEAGFWNQAVGHLEQIRDSVGTPHIAAQIRAIDILSDKLGETKQARKKLDSLLAERPKSDTIYYPILLWKKAGVEMAAGNEAEARRLLNQIKQNFKNYYDRTPLVQLMLAQSFEKENNWERAKLEYDLLFEKFPYSDEAMGSYLHVAQYYQKHNEKDESRRTISDARDTYHRAIELGKGTLAEARASSFMADLYVLDQKYDSAGQMLINIADNFRGTLIARRALASAADIYQNKLGERAKADSLREAAIINLNQPVEPVDLSDQVKQ